MLAIERHIHKHILKAHSTPASFFCSLNGDMNLHPEDSPPRSLDKPNLVQSATSESLTASAPPRKFEARWKLIFDKLVEVKTEMFTHVNISSLTTSCIDRAFISISPSSTTVMQFLGGSIRTPMEWHAMNLSDHAPTYWSIAQVNRESSLPPKIPPYVCKSSFFQQSMQNYLNEVDLATMSPHERMACTKTLIHEAARVAKDKILSQANRSQFGLLASLSSIARCMWRADLHSAEL